MALAQLRIAGLRCLSDVELELDAAWNFIFGPNGAGKTSILEGIFVLGRGRSFRTRQSARLVAHGTSGFAVFGEVSTPIGNRRLGVSFANGHLEKRIDAQDAGTMAALATLLPVQSIDPGSHQLVEGGPSERRRFLDWGVFHVEHDYLEAWRRYRRTLSQRNAALKSGGPRAVLRSWTQAVVETGMAVHQGRDGYVTRLAPWVHDFGRELLEQELSVEYRKGWSKELSLEAALVAGEHTDLAHGTTGAGPHRADIEILLSGRRVQDEASRGQQKLAAAALILAQLAASPEPARQVLLVDDPAAELDRGALGRLLRLLERLPVQRVLTGLSPEQLKPLKPYPVFHVERGALRKV